MVALFTAGGYEWIIILIVALLLFGRRLPEMMRSLGQGVRMFKKGLRDVEEEVDLTGEGEASNERKELPSGGSGPGPSSPAG